MSDNPGTAVTDVDNDKVEGSSAPLPSLEERRNPPNREEVGANPETRRIRWTLNGPLETSITVARDYFFDPDEVPEPYYLGSASGKPTWHPFAHSPLTEPKVSSLWLVVEALDDWDYHWTENHRDHTEPDLDIYDPAEVLYGPIPGDGDEEHLLICCGTKCPVGKKTGEVVISPTTSGGDFVTIHDFISAVHSYLMARRDDLLLAIAEDSGRLNAPPVGPDTRLVVDIWPGLQVDVEDDAYWVQRRKRRPKRQGKKLTSREMEERVMRMVQGRSGTGVSS